MDIEKTLEADSQSLLRRNRQEPTTPLDTCFTEGLFPMLRWTSLFSNRLFASRLAKGVRRKRRREPGLTRRLAVETLEDRRMLAVITVTGTGDTIANDGLVTLREAITAANTNAVSGDAGAGDAGLDMIQFAAGLSGMMVTLDPGGEGALPTIIEDLTITTVGLPAGLVINGNDPSPAADDGIRIFNIDDGNNTALIDVTLFGLTLTGGDSSTEGGAIRSRENLTIANTTISGNRTSKSGGGVYGTLGTTTITNSTISENMATVVGGGIHISGGGPTLTITNSTISENMAINGGGGINTSFGTAMIANSTIFGNTTNSSGGGIRGFRSTTTIINSSVFENTASMGGGLHASVGTTTITGSTIFSNSASSDGGGVSANLQDSGGTLTITNSTISGNMADGNGGGVWTDVNAGQTLTIQHSTITLNESDFDAAGGGSGGGVYLGDGAGDAILEHTIIAGNLDNSNVAPDLDNTTAATHPTLTATFSLIGDNTGSGLTEAPVSSPDGDGNLIGDPGGSGIIVPLLGPLNPNGGPTRTHALLAGSPAIDAGDTTSLLINDQRGAPFLRQSGANVDIGAYERQTVAALSLIVDTLVDENDGDFSPGDFSLREAIGLANGSLGFDTITFATALSGGTINLVMDQIEITEGLSIQGLGASNLTIVGNSRLFDFIHPTDDFEIAGMTITGGSTTGNNANLLDTTYSGGAVRSLSTGNLTITGSLVTDSYTLGQYATGGAISAVGNVTLTNSTVSGNNTAGDYARGGGVFSFGNVTLTNSTVSGNSTAGNDADGGGIFSFSTVTLTRSTISGNTASAGGGIYATGESLSVAYSTIDNNYARDGHGGGLFLDEVVTTLIDSSTISNNRADDHGGGLFIRTIDDDATDQEVRIQHTTITENTADSNNGTIGSGGGIYLDNGLGDLILDHTIVALNVNDTNGFLDIFSRPGGSDPVITARFSLVGDNTGVAAMLPAGNPDGNGNKIGTVAAPIDPLLGPLANNGGPTETHALLPGSPAIDMGDPAFASPPAFDQRGFPFDRVSDGDNDTTPVIDIGAFEVFVKPRDRFELNDTIGTATTLGSEVTVIERDLNIQNNDDVDYFVITANQTGKLLITVPFTGENGNLLLQVRDSNDMIIDSIIVAPSLGLTPAVAVLAIPVVSQERYYVRISGLLSVVGADLHLCYDLEIENFPAPVPTGIHLDPTSDLGRLNNDELTSDDTPTLIIQTDVLGFVDANRNNVAEAGEIDVLTAAEAAAGNVPGIGVEVTLINTTNPAQPPVVAFADPLIPAFPTVYTFTPAAPLADGVYFATARTVIIDAQTPNELGRSGVSEPLWFTVDTLKPNVFFGDAAIANDGLDPSSDSNVAADRITNDSTPTFFGTSEANTTVRVYVLNATGSRVLIGETVATPFNGNNPLATGRWTLTSTIDMNDPLLGFGLLDGLRQFEVEAEDVAGNLSQGVGFELHHVPRPINDNTSTSFTITVGNFVGPITDLEVGLDITHAALSELTATLTSPTGTVVQLFTGLTGANLTGTLLDDEAATPIAAGAAPYTGPFQPTAALAGFDGEDPTGDWILTMTDNAAGNAGTLDGWSLWFQSNLDVFIDSQGPQVQNVFLTDFPTYDLFDPKPSTDGPTPLVDRITVKFTDLPARLQEFLYPAVNEGLATTIGNYQLTGDQVGNIFIKEILFNDLTQPGGGGGGAAIGSGGVIIDGGDREEHGSAMAGPDAISGTVDDINIDGWQFIQQMVEYAAANNQNSGVGILVVGASSNALDAIESVALVLRIPLTLATTGGAVDLATVNFNDFAILYVPTDEGNTNGGVLDADLDTLTLRKTDVQNFVNSGGSLVALTEADYATPYSWLELPDTFTIGNSSTNTQYQTQALIDAGLVITDGELINGTPLHNSFTGPVGFNGLQPFVYNVGTNGMAENGGGDDEIVTLGLGQGGFIGGGMVMTEVTLVFNQFLPDDRYTLTVNDSIRDDAGNALDGESQAGSPFESGGFQNVVFPSGDGIPGGDFVARFTIDTRPEIGVWAAGTVLVDTNGNFLFDPENTDATNRDIVYRLGFAADSIFAGNFVQSPRGVADGFDKLAAYGRVDGVWRFLIDFDNDGVPNAGFNSATVDGLPVAGNFDGNAINGDEVGVFDGNTWFLDTNRDFSIGAGDTTITANYTGIPFVGDFNGDGIVDGGTYSAVSNRFGGNIFTIDLGLDGVADQTFRVGVPGLGAVSGFNGFPGVRERPVAADMNADGVDDIGLWVPDGSVLVPGDQGEWYFFLSDNDRTTMVVENTVLDRATAGGGFIPFTPTPFGNDLFARFGNSFALPIVGNFDPPVVAATGVPSTISLPTTNQATTNASSPIPTESQIQPASTVVEETSSKTVPNEELVVEEIVSLPTETNQPAKVANEKEKILAAAGADDSEELNALQVGWAPPTAQESVSRKQDFTDLFTEVPEESNTLSKTVAPEEEQASVVAAKEASKPNSSSRRRFGGRQQLTPVLASATEEVVPTDPVQESLEDTPILPPEPKDEAGDTVDSSPEQQSEENREIKEIPAAPRARRFAWAQWRRRSTPQETTPPVISNPPSTPIEATSDDSPSIELPHREATLSTVPKSTKTLATEYLPEPAAEEAPTKKIANFALSKSAISRTIKSTQPTEQAPLTQIFTLVVDPAAAEIKQSDKSDSADEQTEAKKPRFLNRRRGASFFKQTAPLNGETALQDDLQELRFDNFASTDAFFDDTSNTDFKHLAAELAETLGHSDQATTLDDTLQDEVFDALAEDFEHAF